MLGKVVMILTLAVFLTGCGRQSTFVNVNLPLEDIKPSVNGVTSTGAGGNNVTNTNTNINKNTNVSAPVPTKVEIPAKLELKVAFAPQAPFGNWNELHEEACEEASMITAAKYFLSQPLTEAIMEEEIAKLDAWEKSNGYKIDLSASQTAAVLEAYFKVQAEVSDDVSVDRIKYELSRGNLIIVPAAGRELDNPYFRSPGPIYHMLVIRGYNSSEFIVNEVGTKRGDGFKYKYQTLISAVHDWDPAWSHYEVIGSQMSAQPKRMVIVSK